jgi:hypothetical protein
MRNSTPKWLGTPGIIKKFFPLADPQGGISCADQRTLLYVAQIFWEFSWGLISTIIAAETISGQGAAARVGRVTVDEFIASDWHLPD